MRYILKPIYNQKGFEEQQYETHVELKYRALIVEQACFFGHDHCVNTAHATYRIWMQDKTKNL